MAKMICIIGAKLQVSDLSFLPCSSVLDTTGAAAFQS